MTSEMTALSETLELIPGETPSSFVSRLAAANLAASAREFCRDFLLSFDKIAAGDQIEISKLAFVGSAPFDELFRNAPQKVSVHEFRIGAAVVPRAIAKRNSVRLCPTCAANDIADAPNLRADAAVAGRSLWLVGSIRTCPLHHRALVEVQKVDRGNRLHDFALAAGEALDDLPLVLQRSEKRTFSDFERYIRERIWPSERHCSYPLLDKLSAADAAMVCEWLGRYRLAGPKSWPSNVSDADMYAAAQSGFEILRDGASRLRRLIVASHNQAAPPSGSSGRARNLLGVLHHFFDSGVGSKPAFDAIRRVIATTLCEIYPYGPDDGPLLGFPIAKRRLHSLSSAANAYGLSIETIRMYAEQAKITRPAHRLGQSKQILIGAVAADELFGATGHVLSATDVFRTHGLSLQTLRELASPGMHVLRPIGGIFKPEGTTHFRTDDVEALRKCLGGAMQEAPPNGMVPLADAARQAGLSVAQVIKLLLDKHAAFVAITGFRPNMGIYVEVGELRRKTSSSGVIGYSLREAARYLKMDEPVIQKLADRGVLRAVQERRSQTGRWRTTYLASDIEAFEQRYVTLSSLRTHHRWNASQAATKIKAAKLSTAFSPAKIGCSIFERAELPAEF